MKFMAFLFAFAIVVAAVFANDDQNGDIQGREQLHQEIVLTGTTFAPYGASGKAMLEAENEDGIGSAGLEIETRGLIPGMYTVTVTRKSDSSLVDLGAFAVGASSNNIEQDYEVEIKFGTEKGLMLPEDLSPLDIASIAISDFAGHVVLAGDFMNAAETLNAFFKAKVAVDGREGTTGTAVIRTRTRQGLRTERFKLNVNGVTPNATLDLKINGEDFGTVTTDKHGRLRLNSLPEGVEPESIILMEFNDPDGTNALSISF